MGIKSLILFSLLFLSGLEASEKYVGLFVNRDFRGELSFAYRIQFACRNIGWKADVIDIPKKGEFRDKKYDFVINLIPGAYKHAGCKNYLAIFHPLHHYFNKKGFLFRKYCSYDGYLLTYSPAALGKKRKSFANPRKYPFMSWYPTVQKQNAKAADPSSLFYICCSWGNRFEDEKFQNFLKRLDSEPYTRFYGSSIFQSAYPESYRGEIAYDDESLYEMAANAGVALVLHSSDHNQHGIPSGRIFEAAAASCIIISDRNAFVQNTFGDNVLYINTGEDAVSIFNQIRGHMNWIRENKLKALEMAKKANQIFKENFLLEDQLLRLGEFHDRLTHKPGSLFWTWLQSLGLS